MASGITDERPTWACSSAEEIRQFAGAVDRRLLARQSDAVPDVGPAAQPFPEPAPRVTPHPWERRVVNTKANERQAMVSGEEERRRIASGKRRELATHGKRTRRAVDRHVRTIGVIPGVEGRHSVVRCGLDRLGDERRSTIGPDHDVTAGLVLSP